MSGGMVVTLSNHIVTSGGGPGGPGGKGGDGGSGGAAGEATDGGSYGWYNQIVNPHLSWEDAGDGGRGNQGGRGGGGGGGSGGAGGCSCGELALSGFALWPLETGNTYEIGPGGAGGAGGLGGAPSAAESVGNPGETGQAAPGCGNKWPLPPPSHYQDLLDRFEILQRLHELGEPEHPDVEVGVRFDTGDIILRLRTPGGDVIDRTTPPPPYVSHSRGPGFEFIRVRNAEPGTWTVELEGSAVPPGGEIANLHIQELPGNGLPSADPGLNRVIEATGPGGATVQLDGSGSLDPNGDLLNYRWRRPPLRTEEEQAIVEYDLPLGTHRPILTVDDGFGGLDSAEVEITVVDTTPPWITLSAQTLVATTDQDSMVVSLEGVATATDLVDPLPSIWFDPPSGAYFPKGWSSVQCFASDAFDNVASDTLLVFVTDPATTVEGRVMASDPSTGLVFAAVGARVELFDSMDVLVTDCVADTGGYYLLSGVPVAASYRVTAGGLSGYTAWPDTTMLEVGYWPVSRNLLMRPDRPAWTDATESPLDLRDSHEGVAWADYDGSGYPDILAFGWNSRLFANRGETFEDVSGSLFYNSSYGGAWGDYDGDGDLDFFTTRYDNTYENRLYVNLGEGRFQANTPQVLQGVVGGRGVSWVDFNLDGLLDLFIANVYLDQPTLFANLGQGNFVDVTPPALSGGAYDGCWCDYDQDGDQDVLLSGALVRNDGNGDFTPVWGAGGGTCHAWGDFDGDGDQDVYSDGNGGHLFRNDGSDVFTEVTPSGLESAYSAWSATWVDADNDGDLDLSRTNRAPGVRSDLMRNDGDGVFTRIEIGPIGPGAFAGAWADFDEDGDIEPYTTMQYGWSKLLENEDGNWFNWLKVRLVGSTSNSWGIGARVRAVICDHSLIREVGIDRGLFYQNPMIASFGLGLDGVVDTLQVFWPSGVVQQRIAVEANQTIVLTEPNVTGEGDEPISYRLSLAPCRPNPVRTTATVRYELPAPAEVDLKIYDISGRLVRDLVSGRVQLAGPHSVVWNRRSDTGHTVSAGAYLLRLKVGGETKTSTMVVLQ